jgi:hypothetical protein
MISECVNKREVSESLPEAQDGGLDTEMLDNEVSVMSEVVDLAASSKGET